jgi:hypothetical protein
MVRVLIILSVLLASIGFGPLASARSGLEPACHSMSVNTDQPGEQNKHDGAVPITHVCVGCALVGDQVHAGPADTPIAAPLKPHNDTAPSSFNANPIPPPPRTA